MTNHLITNSFVEKMCKQFLSKDDNYLKNRIIMYKKYRNKIKVKSQKIDDFSQS